MGSTLDVIWVILCAILVSTMQAGFCCLESGLVRAKNSINVAIKNLVDFCIASLLFSLIGFQLMFGATAWGLIGTQLPTAASWSAGDYTFFLFELTFCGTATTIVSGAVAERMSFLGYFFTAVILSSLIYPVVGHWVWGGIWFDTPSGWLRQLQFHDFAGATVVHAVGGWMAFAAILILGPRLGRFSPKPRPIDGHNLPTAVLGVFLLWFGWFGFSGGSTLGFSDQVPKILVNTAQGGAAGGLTALATTWALHKRPRVPLIMNGVVGGLVSITAGCDILLPLGAVCAGGVGGLLCTLSAGWLSRRYIDDAVGVVPAHLVCGIWGTLAVALFGDPHLWAPGYGFWQRLGLQSLGVTVVGLYAFTMSYGLLMLVNRLSPLRVTSDKEYIGLNISEHGASTATQELITSMNNHSLRGDFTQPVAVEFGTDVAPIANHYNQVLAKMHRIQIALNTSQERLLTILNSPAFPVVISEPDSGIIQFLNERSAELFGFTLPETGRYREPDFWHDLTTRDMFLQQVNDQKRVNGFEACLSKVDGATTFWSLISGLEMTYDGQACVLFSFSDISDQIERESALRRLASTDSLTGVYNRRAFLEQANKTLSLAMCKGWQVVILMLDIDHFKQINDQFGHARGDLVIQSVAQACTAVLREHSLVGRFGGEEFVMLLSDTSLDIAQAVAEGVRSQIQHLQIVEGLQVTVSIGIAAIQPNETLETTLKQADKALYLAKSRGRNRVELG
ncbi:ammonium transporter [Leptolyngbya cf. ectocarpi LEGE 11479]|uniref:Ammonium transporter n=1 Tax=Leptolyngbya cf. ectocarpi LEGE 11479 TaxID=1828722 RepID=A0A928X0K7_LEPEC|nr:ammonium transporter [Leptolyngbya ectocarpi]MBE9066742.1 ammonium transporter [Leptolyngbya cf. ectocarpi LEGE 11479]